LYDEKQDEIIREAGEEFADKGYERASLNAIIEKAGISKGSLYYYFENKQDLFSTVLEQASSKVMRQLVGFSLDELNADNFWGELERVVKEVASYASGHRWYIRLLRTFYRLRDREPGSVRETDMFDLSRKWADRVIERGQQLDVIRTDVPREFLIEMALAIAEAGDRWFLDHFEDYDDLDFEREAERQIDVFKRILAPPEEL
ncbi:MAG: TetR/AcrR family transcriptional regulator, partial [Bradymonadaceae bacterium]